MVSKIFARILLATFFISLTSVPSFSQIRKDSVWIQDPNGCKVYNPNPIKDETISWSGQCSNGYASGTGTLVWYKKGKQNQEYVGDMHRGKPHGKGRYLYQDGTRREGTYRNGQQDGEGEIIHVGTNGRISSLYRGQFKEGNRSGKGSEIEFNERGDTVSIYTGDFLDNEIQGKGISKEFDEGTITVSQGNFNTGELSGKVEIRGYEHRKLFATYKGDFSAFERNGHGDLITGRITYSGNWQYDLRMGSGKLYLDTMLIYDGNWEYDKMSGLGKRYYFDGSHYVGDFKTNTRHGVGIQYWKDGTRYIGEFKNDLFFGNGYIYKDGKVITSGKWENGQLISRVDPELISNTLFSRYKTKLLALEISSPH